MRKHCLVVATILIGGSGAASSQAVSFGVKGGIPFGDTNGTHDESRPYIVGPSIEVRLPANFAIEVDGLYRRLGNSIGFSYQLNSVSAAYFNRDRGNSWEFPFLGKYYFRSRSESWQPYVGTGWALRRTWFHSDASGFVTDESGGPRATNSHSDYVDSLGVGAVVAAGLRFHRGRLAFAPELRYTRWGSANFQRNPRNEGGILLGISF